MKNEILKILSYFDIFCHPLKQEEILRLCLNNTSHLDTTLNELIQEEKCFTHNGYYSIQKEVGDFVKTRKEKEELAESYFNKLPFYAKLIKSFPFVRGIALSGSLSKKVMYSDGDIDYFIITTANRLWICRTLLVLFKKVFLLNSKRYFCVNYFVDVNNLEIIDKNIFTAIEISHLIPVFNKGIFDQLKKENEWTEQFISSFDNTIDHQPLEGNSIGKRAIEFLLNNKIGDYIDLFFMKLTLKKWGKKFPHFSSEKFELTMRTNRGVSKHHPKDFQNKVLREYELRLKKLKIHESTLHA